MTWDYVGATLLFAFIGYLLGSLSMAVLLTKSIKKEDVRDKGSGNAGATNTMRNYGKKLAFAVFILDILKVVVAMMIAWSVKTYAAPEMFSGIVIQAAGFAAVVGHIWPVWFKFKGGKGAATTVGFILGSNWVLVLVGMVLFFLIVYLTKKASVGSILSIFILIWIQLAYVFIPHANEAWSMPLIHGIQWWVTPTFMAGIWILVTYKHIPNIKRLMAGEESSIV